MKRGILWAGSAAVLMAVVGGIGLLAGASPDDTMSFMIIVLFLVTGVGGIVLLAWDM